MLLRFLRNWISFAVLSFAVYWLLWYLIDRQVFEADGYGWGVVLFDFCYCAVFALVTLLISRGVFRLSQRITSNKWMFITSSLLVLALNVATAVLFETATDWFIYGDTDLSDLTEGIYVYSLVASVLSCILLGVWHYRLYSAQYEARRKAEVALKKNQLEPHFIFNSLATLDGLMDLDREAAHKYLAGLSRLYRHVLQYIDDRGVPIAEAMQVIRSYTQLLAVHYRDHLQFDIDPALDRCAGYVLPMTLQQLVENAVKHNVHSADQPLRIRIYKEGDWIVCANTHRPNNVDTDSCRTGLTNLRARYRFYTGQSCPSRCDDGQFVIRMPIMTKSPDAL